MNVEIVYQEDEIASRLRVKKPYFAEKRRKGRTDQVESRFTNLVVTQASISINWSRRLTGETQDILGPIHKKAPDSAIKSSR